MELTLQHFLIVCPMVFVAGFIDAIAGGGGLITVPAYIFAGLPPHNAIATNKMSSFMGTSVATAHFAKSGFIPWKIAGSTAIIAIIGSSLGAKLVLSVSDFYIQIFMLLVLPVVAFYVLRTKNFDDNKKGFSKRKTMIIAMCSAFIFGIYDGFYGPGTGTFLLLVLTGLAHLPLTESNGTTKIINLSTNFGALTIFLLNGKTIIPLGLVAGLFSIAGNYIGANFFAKRSTKIVKPIMLFVLVLFFVKVVTDLIG